jgi:hypothetical protein
LQSFQALDSHRDFSRPLDTAPSGTVYGAPGFVSSRYITVFNGVMAPTITSATASLEIRSRRIEPASFA